jgi:hypothetical protein
MSFRPILPDRRKDTAAYASLSFFTCQRAPSRRDGQQNREPSLLALARQDPRSSPPAPLAVAAVDEECLSDPGGPVNSFSEESLKKSSDRRRPEDQAQQNRSRTRIIVQAALGRERRTPRQRTGFCPRGAPIPQTLLRKTWAHVIGRG